MTHKGQAQRTPPTEAAPAKALVILEQGKASSRITSPVDAPSGCLSAISLGPQVPPAIQDYSLEYSPCPDTFKNSSNAETAN